MANDKNGGLSIGINGRSERGKRSIQQDCIGWSDIQEYGERGVLAVLSDGMGGMKNGEVYSDIAVQQMLAHFREHGPDKDMIATVLKCYAHARRCARARCPVPEEPEGGATVVAVYVRDGRCAFLSVGDSRLYLWRANALLQLNREQTLGVLLDENAALGYIPKEYAKSGLRDTIENNLCEPEVKRCDMPARPFALAKGDRLLLMSDGISHTLTDREIARALAGSKTDFATAIEAAVRDKGNPRQDNYTVLEMCIQ